MTMRYCFS